MSWFKADYNKKDSKNSTVTFKQAENRENIASGEQHSTIFGKIAKYFADLKDVAFTGSYNDLSDNPKSLPASDVYDWAKQPNKPSYNASEVGAAATSHTHSDYLKYLGGYTEVLNFKGPFKVLHSDGGGAAAGYTFDILSVFTDVTKARIQYQVRSNNTFDLSPTSLGPGYLGTTYPWKEIRGEDIYNSGGVITSSDRNKKKDFEQITQEFADAIIDGLIPTSFLYKDGTSGRRHYALIAQDVEKLLESLGIDSKDFAPLVKDYPTKEIKSENEDDAEPEYNLRYEGFIGFIIKYVQGLKTKFCNTEAKYDALEKRIIALEKANN